MGGLEDSVLNLHCWTFIDVHIGYKAKITIHFNKGDQHIIYNTHTTKDFKERWKQKVYLETQWNREFYSPKKRAFY